MKKMIYVMALCCFLILQPGCFYAERETFLYEYREPAQQEAGGSDPLVKNYPDKWYESLAVGLGNLVGMNWIAAAFREVRLERTPVYFYCGRDGRAEQLESVAAVVFVIRGSSRLGGIRAPERRML